MGETGGKETIKVMVFHCRPKTPKLPSTRPGLCVLMTMMAGDYWKKVAEKWNTTEEAARTSLCANCTAFDISPRMLECMPGETSDDDGVLGYCWMHHFKCHSARACHTWAKGGPIKDDKISYIWGKKAFGGKDD